MRRKYPFNAAFYFHPFLLKRIEFTHIRFSGSIAQICLFCCRSLKRIKWSLGNILNTRSLLPCAWTYRVAVPSPFSVSLRFACSLALSDRFPSRNGTFVCQQPIIIFRIFRRRPSSFLTRGEERSKRAIEKRKKRKHRLAVARGAILVLIFEIILVKSPTIYLIYLLNRCKKWI